MSNRNASLDIKWSLWHGNVFRSLRTVENLEIDLETFDESREQKKLLKALKNLDGNQGLGHEID